MLSKEYCLTLSKNLRVTSKKHAFLQPPTSNSFKFRQNSLQSYNFSSSLRQSSPSPFSSSTLFYLYSSKTRCQPNYHQRHFSSTSPSSNPKTCRNRISPQRRPQPPSSTAILTKNLVYRKKNQKNSKFCYFSTRFTTPTGSSRPSPKNATSGLSPPYIFEGLLPLPYQRPPLRLPPNHPQRGLLPNPPTNRITLYSLHQLRLLHPPSQRGLLPTPPQSHRISPIKRHNRSETAAQPLPLDTPPPLDIERSRGLLPKPPQSLRLQQTLHRRPPSHRRRYGHLNLKKNRRQPPNSGQNPHNFSSMVSRDFNEPKAWKKIATEPPTSSFTREAAPEPQASERAVASESATSSSTIAAATESQAFKEAAAPKPTSLSSTIPAVMESDTLTSTVAAVTEYQVYQRPSASEPVTPMSTTPTATGSRDLKRDVNSVSPSDFFNKVWNHNFFSHFPSSHQSFESSEFPPLIFQSNLISYPDLNSFIFSSSPIVKNKILISVGLRGKQKSTTGLNLDLFHNYYRIFGFGIHALADSTSCFSPHESPFKGNKRLREEGVFHFALDRNWNSSLKKFRHTKERKDIKSIEDRSNLGEINEDRSCPEEATEPEGQIVENFSDHHHGEDRKDKVLKVQILERVDDFFSSEDRDLKIRKTRGCEIGESNRKRDRDSAGLGPSLQDPPDPGDYSKDIFFSQIWIRLKNQLKEEN